MTYKALGRPIANYAALVWSINASESNIGKIQCAQNEALRIITGSRKMSSIDHQHSETKMLQVDDHLNLLSAQYLVQCLYTENVCHHITKMELPPREMKETIFTRHYQTVLPVLVNKRKDTLQEPHTAFVNTAIDNMKDNRVLSNRPPPINDEETHLSRWQRTTLSQLRSGRWKLLNSYKKTIEAKWFFKLSRLCNGSTGCTSPIARLTPMICHLWTYGTGQPRRYGNWAFWTRTTWINRRGWLTKAYNNN